MAVLKCKMCGATLNVPEGKTVATCEYCGSTQTIPLLDDEKKINLYKRANELRYDFEYDKASLIFENIVSEFENESEAYWGLVLCRYGIEYVDDPKTGTKIPTCHRTQVKSIFDDKDYKKAIKYSDVVSRELYISEAKQIDYIQKGILDVSSNEEPFDIFICYKETENDGSRSQDSVIAQEIYEKLIENGYSVFFSKITLEKKIGCAYEPYIFAALQSSKIMIHVTTSSEHSEAVWVKNEWSRYLNLINNGKRKVLIPVYKEMSAYDLPLEMKNLQGVDYSKIGSLQDLIYGVKKIAKPSKISSDQAFEIIESYQKLFESGAISEEEFEEAKNKILAAVLGTKKTGVHSNFGDKEDVSSVVEIDEEPKVEEPVEPEVEVKEPEIEIEENHFITNEEIDEIIKNFPIKDLVKTGKDYVDSYESDDGLIYWHCHKRGEIVLFDSYLGEIPHNSVGRVLGINDDFTIDIQFKVDGKYIVLSLINQEFTIYKKENDVAQM